MKSPLVEALLNPEVYPHPCQKLEVKETHISWVILTGEFVYKIKKPVDFEFLNYTELSMRKHFCEEECRLNHRLAKELYLEVVPIYGEESAPSFKAKGQIIEYAVKMRQFDSSQQFDVALANGNISDSDIDEVAIHLAEFHQSTEVVAKDKPYGKAEQIFEPVQQNFQQMQELIQDPLLQTKLNQIKEWSFQQHQQLTPTFSLRRDQNKIRECHGDFYMANITRYHDKVAIFDCIEFNEPFRMTDTIADVGFLMMDLLDKHHPDLAYRFLSTYMESTEDFHGLLVLRYYTVYRAMVRTKINAFRLAQEEEGSAVYQECLDAIESLLKLSLKLIEPPQKLILMMHGFSGSGKTTVSNELLHLGMIRIRSDVIRKQLLGLAINEKSGSGIAGGLYSDEMSVRTYQALMEKARVILTSGYPVIIDATFLKHEQRELFRHLSEELTVPWLIVDCRANQRTLETRLTDRVNDQAPEASEATVDVLKFQENTRDALTEQEKQHMVIYQQDNLDELLNQIHNTLFMQATLIE